MAEKNVADAVTSVVVHESSNPFFESALIYLNFVRDAFFLHDKWKSDLMMRLGFLDYPVFFRFP